MPGETHAGRDAPVGKHFQVASGVGPNRDCRRGGGGDLLRYVRAAADAPIPSTLPKYDLDIVFDSATHRATIRERVAWTNITRTATDQLAFNFYPHFQVTKSDSLLFSKTFELLRLQPTLGIETHGKMGDVNSAQLLPANGPPVPLKWSYEEKNSTAFRFDLPAPVQPGQTVVVELVCEVRLPNRQGRWGYYEGVTYLTNAIPVVAYYDDNGWQPKPFVPWHQPWFNEAGVFRATITVPENESVACSAVIKSETKLGTGTGCVECEPFVGRDYAILSSARYREFLSPVKLPDGRTVTLRCMAFPEHEFYAQEILRIVGEAIPVYSQWFSAVSGIRSSPAESYFGWERHRVQAGLTMIDEPSSECAAPRCRHCRASPPDETCHPVQKNMIGTNGYSETFMDEGHVHHASAAQ